MARRIVESVRSLSQRLGSPGGDPPAMSSRPFPSPLGVETTRFRVDVKPERDVVFVVPTGELDLATVAQLAGQIDELRAASFKRVVLDLSRLEFMDSSGLHLLVELDRRAHTGGQEFAVIPGPPTIQRLFELTGAGDRLRFQNGVSADPNGDGPSRHRGPASDELRLQR